jgi:hypothetical protein
MRRMKSLVAAVCVLASLAPVLAGQDSQPPARRVAIFGSSVAFGTGDESGQQGYAGLLGGILQPRGWQVMNQSRPGDNTQTLMSRFAPDSEAPPARGSCCP